MPNTNQPALQLVVFDWAGTTIDHGCRAPVAAFTAAFRQLGIDLTDDQVRGPMGLHKRDHIRTLLELPEVSAEWRQQYQRPWNESDIETLYQLLPALQQQSARQCNQLVPGLIDCVAALRSRGMRIGSTTGYPRSIAEPVFAAAQEQGYRPDHSVCADDVPAARPAPWMIFRNMEALDVFPPRCVVKVGDTAPDIEEGLNAGAWSIGVIQTGSEVGWTAEELASKPVEEREAKFKAAETKLRSAGAHYVIPSVADLPNILNVLQTRLEQGERP